MLGFSKAPRDSQSFGKYEVLRVPAGRKLTLICLSAEHEGVNTHYNGSRSVICPDPLPCDWCETRPARWRGYVYATPAIGGKIYILEFTAGVAHVFNDWLQSNGTLRGAHVILQRKGKRPQGRLTAEILNMQTASSKLPDVEGLAERLAAIYDVPHLTADVRSADNIINRIDPAANGRPARKTTNTKD